MGTADTRQTARTIVSPSERPASPPKAGKPKVIQSGMHLAKKLFCVSGNRLGLGTWGRAWMAIGGQPRPSQNGETDYGGGTVGIAER
jgi:hypothetical protein